MSFTSLEQQFIDNLIGVDPNRKRIHYENKLVEQNQQRPMLEIERIAQEARLLEANTKLMFVDFTQAHLHDVVAEEMLKRLSSLEVITSSLFDLGPSFGSLLDVLSSKSVSVNQMYPLVVTIDWLCEDLLRLINSPKYKSKNSSGGLIKDVKTALRFLGVETLQSIIPVYALRRCLPHSTEPFVHFKTNIWEYSLASALAARTIATHQGYSSFTVFCAALFQALGHLVVARNYLRSYREVKLNVQKRAQEEHETQLIDALELLNADASFLSSSLEEFAPILSADLVFRWQLQRMPLATILDQIADETPLQLCLESTRILLQANCFVQVTFLKRAHKLTQEEASAYLDKVQLSSELRQELARTDLQRLNFE